MWIIAINLLAPIGRMRPNEVEAVASRKPLVGFRVGGVESAFNIGGKTWDGEFGADILTGAAPGHRVKDVCRAKEQEEVFDKTAAAVAGVTAIAVISGAVEMVKAGQMRNRARISRRLRIRA